MSGATEDAARVAGHLEAIRRIMRESVWAAAQRHPVPLTPPQLRALEILVDDLRESGSGLSLSDLSRRMGLAHSTVSGIVMRLERRGLLRRATRPDDRRYLRIELTPPVREWLDRDLSASRLEPLTRALANATDAERASILDGLATLERLIHGR
jgi:DNA-binding MarR family transcriptional regulator